MKRLDERGVLRRMRSLADLTPDAGQTRFAIDAARSTIRRRQIARWATGGIAAIAAVIVLAYLDFSPSLTSAEAALTEAVNNTDQYKGWVHEYNSDEGSSDLSVAHYNSDTGASANETHSGNALYADMFVPAEKKRIRYDSHDGRIVIDAMQDNFADVWKRVIQQLPWTVAGQLSELKVKGLTVVRTTDHGLDRFDVTFPPDDAKKAAEENRTVYPTRAIFCSNPQTKRIVEVRGTFAGRTSESRITYGAPAIRDVYDLGVPRNAVVVDNRPDGKVKGLLDQIHQHFLHGLGDYAAIETISDSDSADVTVYGHQGESTVSAHFTGSAASALDGWPTPTLDAALASVAHARPQRILVVNGQNAWVDGRADGPDNTATDEKWLSLPGKLWPEYELMIGADDWKSRLLSDPSRPGLIGLQVDCLYFGGAPDDSREHLVYWFDPAKDYATVEWFQKYTIIATNKLDREYHATSEAFARTADGRWYPSTWKRDNGDYEYHLQIWTDRKLGPEWYKPPVAVQSGNVR